MGLSPNNTLFQGKFGYYIGTGGVLKNGGDLTTNSLSGEISFGESNSKFYVNDSSSGGDPFTYVNILEPYDQWHFIIDE